jgi:ABC-2 type transport system permease protein
MTAELMETPGAAVPVPPASLPSGATIGGQIARLAGRSLHTLREPGLLLPSLLEPFLLLLLFSQVFGSIAETPDFPGGMSYVNYLLPAILITTTVGAGLKSGTMLLADMRNGLIGRFRAMPIWTGSILIGRSIADGVLNAVQLSFMLVIGLLLFGFRPAGGITGALGTLAVALLVGWSLGWVFMALAAMLRRPEALHTVGGLVTVPLMFASNAFVPADSLPGWLRVVAEVNPLSYAITATRGLAAGDVSATAVLAPIGICAVLVLLFAPLAIRSFRRT